MARFRLLHITDLHISLPPDEPGDLSVWMGIQALHPSRARKQVLDAVAEFIIDKQSDIDVVMVTGDLADDGLNHNLEAAKAFLAEAPAGAGSSYTVNGHPTISGLDPGRTLFVLPGNHDRFDGLFRQHGGMEFDSVFADYWDKGLNGVRSLIVGKSDGSLALVAADFCCRPGAALFNLSLGQGEVHADTLADLETETARLRSENPGIAVFWVFHFPPILDVESELRLRSAETAIAKAIELGIPFIFAGHLHRNQSVQYEGVQIVCTASTASEHRDFYGNWIRIVEIENGPSGLLVSRNETYRYDPKHMAFVPSRFIGP